MGSTETTYRALLKERYLGSGIVEKLTYPKNPFLAMLQKKGDTGFVGYDLQHWGYFRVVALHELVHALRPDLPHGSIPILTGDSYMAQRPCLTAEDVAAICVGRGCAEQRPTCTL